MSVEPYLAGEPCPEASSGFDNGALLEETERWPPKRFTIERGLADALSCLAGVEACLGMCTSTDLPSRYVGNDVPSMTAGVPGFRSLLG